MSIVQYIVLLCAAVSSSSAGFGHIYSGEHLDNVISKPGTQLVARAAVLVLYTPSCNPPVERMEMDHHLLYLTHDYETSKDFIWYNYREKEDDLKRRYLSAEDPCLVALYFKKGGSVMEPTAVWNEEQLLLEWYWSLLQTDISVANKFTEAIAVSHLNAGSGPLLDSVIIYPGNKATVTSYIGYTFFVTDANSKTMLDAMVVSTNFTRYTALKATGARVEDRMKLDLQTRQREIDWIWSHADRHLRNMKQPLLVHNYTSTGYLKVPMPEDLNASLSRFYQENRKYHQGEEINHLYSIHDHIGSQQPALVQLSASMMDTIEQSLQPMLEAWCGTKLKRTAIYGIREYFKGNLLNNHVDRIETHVISAILQVDQDLGSGEDWTLEVINYQGERQQVKLLPGEMLLYESAKLIHGRPKPFQGNRFANAFVHFAPVEKWDYIIDGRYFKSPSRGLSERLDQQKTSLTEKGRIVGEKDEL